jgi:hypothetical protein
VIHLAATATADQGSLYALLIATGVIWAAGYALACWLWPFRACRACRGTGRRRSPTRRAYRHCRRCDNTGDQIRAGRVLWNYLRD